MEQETKEEVLKRILVKLSDMTAQEITDAFREIWPEDPCLGDFALFGYGVTR